MPRPILVILLAGLAWAALADGVSAQNQAQDQAQAAAQDRRNLRRRPLRPPRRAAATRSIAWGRPSCGSIRRPARSRSADRAPPAGRARRPPTSGSALESEIAQAAARERVAEEIDAGARPRPAGRDHRRDAAGAAGQHPRSVGQRPPRGAERGRNRPRHRLHEERLEEARRHDDRPAAGHSAQELNQS